ncbi:hypothetical protein [Sphingomonas sp. HMP6]|uniref:hypothetical protein n=1 Tax=Sphingomonas sp. HMP6 TaxID=1517551 RepID=UPI0015966293|nr:hypothetical protein [Sphingomonas sp. HMP6]BCA58156.1 hypothetical protein HMP06_0925 [Sphingomonas sp. HMP6]
MRILRAYRSYLRSTVRLVSPILLRALELEQLRLDEVVGRLRPPAGWPWPVGTAHELRHARATAVDRDRVPPEVGAPGPWLRPDRSVDPTVHRSGAGLAVRWASGRPAGLPKVRVHGDSLEVVMDVGPFLLTSVHGLGLLRIDGRRAGTLADDCIGSPVHRLVDHPLFCGQGWTVDRIDYSRHGTGFSTLVFATGQEPLKLPWGA